MIKLFILIMFLACFAFAGFPPTTSKVIGDANNITTFNYLFPNFTGTHTGTTVSLGVNSIAGGGTGQSTKAAAFDALSPMTTAGDLIYGGVSGTGTRLANGSLNQVLTSNGGTNAPSWKSLSTLLDGNYYKFGGNAFGNTAALGTTDAFDLQIIRGGTTKIYAASTGVAIGSLSPATSATLEIQGTTGALLISRLSTTQRNALTASSGMIIYNTSNSRFECYDVAWVPCINTRVARAAVSLAASGSITLGDEQNQTYRVQGASGPITMASQPFGTTATDGMRVTLVGNSNTNQVTIPVGTGGTHNILGYEVTLTKNQSVTYEYSFDLNGFFIVSVSN